MLFLTVNAWRDLAEHAAKSLHHGDRVVVTGRVKQRTYETREGENRTVTEIEAADVGVSLQRATCKIARPSGPPAPATATRRRSRRSSRQAGKAPDPDRQPKAERPGA